MPIQGWHKDSVLHYPVNIDDSISPYEILIVVRNTTEYPYQNLWLFVDEYEEDVCIHRDTIEAMLADEYGRWLGKGSRRYELPLLYSGSHRFTRTGNHTFTIQQGMRVDCLTGITEVGLVIKKNNGQE